MRLFFFRLGTPWPQRGVATDSWGSKPIRSEPIEGHEKTLPYQCWNFAYPNAPGGLDNPMINPIGVAGAPSLAGLGCCRVLVTVSEKDEKRDRGICYYEELIKSNWEGEAELVQVEEEEHAFHILHFETEKAKTLIKRLASFLLKK